MDDLIKSMLKVETEANHIIEQAEESARQKIENSKIEADKIIKENKQKSIIEAEKYIEKIKKDAYKKRQNSVLKADKKINLEIEKANKEKEKGIKLLIQELT